MEARHNCCKAIYQSLTLSDSVSAFTDTYAKVRFRYFIHIYVLSKYTTIRDLVILLAFSFDKI